MLGEIGCVKVVAAVFVYSHEPFALRTFTVYEPAATFEKMLLDCQVVPLIEYCKGATPPFAMIVIVPLFKAQSLGFVALTLEIVGCVKVGMIQFGTLDVQAVFPITLTTTL